MELNFKKFMDWISKQLFRVRVRQKSVEKNFENGVILRMKIMPLIGFLAFNLRLKNTFYF
mgnify:CR=1 FL=1